MIDENLKKYEPFFGKWKISKELGRGAFGSVFMRFTGMTVWEAGHFRR